MVRKISLGILAVAAAAAAVAATPPSRYRIDLTNGAEVVSLDAPSRRGSVLIFHRASDGALDGIPAEMVARIEPGAPAPRGPAMQASAAAERAAGRELEPGEVVDLGAVDDASVTPRADTGATAVAAPQAPPTWNGFYYGYGIGGGPARNPASAALLASVPSSTDLALAQTAAGANTPALDGSNGFPVVPGVPATVIRPDGTPVLDASAATPNIGSNGTPILAPAGTAGSTPLPIGPNGTPILAPAGSPGSASLTIDTGGTPILAPTASPAASAATTVTVSGAAAMPTMQGIAPAAARPAAAASSSVASGVAVHR